MNIFNTRSLLFFIWISSQHSVVQCLEFETWFSVAKNQEHQYILTNANETYEECKKTCLNTYNGSLAKQQAEFEDSFKNALITNFTYTAWTDADETCRLIYATPKVVYSIQKFECSSPAHCLCAKLIQTKATMGTTTTPQPTTTTRTTQPTPTNTALTTTTTYKLADSITPQPTTKIQTLTTTTAIVTSKNARRPVGTSSGIGTTDRPFERCEKNGSDYWPEVNGYAYCLSDHEVSYCEAKRLCQTNNGNISSNVVTKENVFEIANKLGLKGTLYMWANFTKNTCNPDQQNCNIISISSYQDHKTVEFVKITENKTYRVLCEKQISNSTTTIPTCSSALNTLLLSQTQSTQGATIKTSVEQTQSIPTMLSTTSSGIVNVSTSAPNTAQQKSTSNTPTTSTTNTSLQTTLSIPSTTPSTNAAQQTLQSSLPSTSTTNTVPQTPLSNQPTTPSTNTESQSTQRPWIRDNLNEYFVNYNNLTLSDARTFCKISNATLVAFMDVYQYFKLSGKLQLNAAEYWVDAAMSVNDSTCLKLDTFEGSLQSRDCSELAYSICNRFAFQNNISQVLERPEFVEMIRKMTVVKNTTSSAVRKLTSAEDKRTVAKVSGTVAICIIAGTFLIIFLSDLSRILRPIFH